MDTKIRKVLFPTDFSTLSDSALAEASAFARDRGARLLILHVAEPPAAYGSGEMYYGIPDPDDEALREMLVKVVPTDPGVAFEHRLVTGEPATEIVRVSDEEQADMIVMATHGRTGLMRWVLGSVTESVIRHAHCPVLVFKALGKQKVTEGEELATKAQAASPSHI